MARALDILHISDWHCDEERFERELCKIMEDRQAQPDFLIASGDMIEDPMYFWLNHEEAARQQREIWEQMAYGVQRVIPKVEGILAVPGNHDWCDYGIPGVVYSFDKPQAEVIEVGGVRFGGFRGVPEIGNPRFQWSHELDQRAFDWLIAEMNRDVDVVVVHSPPHGILDHVNRYGKGGRPFKESVGIEGLAEWCWQSPRVRACCFGHIHEEGGKVENHRRNPGQEGIVYSNASLRHNWLNIVIDGD